MAGKKEKFRLLDPLGAGAFAQTFKAEVLDESLRAQWGPLVALKIPLTKDKELVLIKEVITNATLQNQLQGVEDPHIVRYLGCETFDQKYVMVMEYVSGGDLRSLMGDIGQQKALSLKKTMDITEQVCLGLIKIHRYHIFHRDLKPENILLSKRDNLAKIADFGIGRMLNSARLASTTTGTIYYMPREVLRGKGGHFYSDIYSLGVTCYEMLTGQVPFNGENVGEIIDKICSGVFLEPSQVNPGIHPALNKIVVKAMSLDHRQRYKTAEELLKELRAYYRPEAKPEPEMDRYLAEAKAALGHTSPREAAKPLAALRRQYPDLEKPYLLLGEFYCYCLLHQEAVGVFQAGLKVFPHSAALHRNLALSLLQLGSFSEAQRELREAIRLAPDDQFAAKLKPILRACQQKMGAK